MNRLRIAIAAGELSGDQLAAQIILELQQQFPGCEIVGIAGDAMVKAGCQQIIDIEQLSVIGIFEIIKSIPQLLSCRRQFINYLAHYSPHIFIGVDAPDFNLPIAAQMKARGVFTVHYNSPKVWAWRQYRVKKIKRAIDLMLTQFPFEADFYQPFGVRAEYVGHPFADLICPTPKTSNDETPIIGLALGSRRSEIKHHSHLFLQTAVWLHQKIPGCRFIVPLANEKCKADFLKCYQSLNITLPLTVEIGNFREAIATTDCVLTAAGTASLEIMLLRKPMVVAYRLSLLTYLLGRCLVRVKYIALPNLLADSLIVPEYIQYAATPTVLGGAILAWLNQPNKVQQLLEHYQVIHHQLAGNAALKSAKLIASHYAYQPDAQDVN